MEKPIKVAVYIADDDAKKFLLFQEHYDVFSVLLDKDVFDQKNATVSLHFDHQGVLQVIQRADYLYSRKHDFK